MTENTPTPGPTPIPAIPAPPPPTLAEKPTASSPSWIGTDDARKLADGLLKAGVPQDRVLAALKADGYDFAIDTRSPEQAELDRQGIGVEHAPSEYKIDWVGRVAEGTDPAKIKAATERLTGFAAATSLMPQAATALVSAMMDDASKLDRMSADQKSLWTSEQTRLGERIAGGAEKWAEKIKLADAALARADKDYVKGLRETGVLSSANAILQLSLAEEARQLRAKVLKK